MTTTEPINGHRVSGTADLPQPRPEVVATSSNTDFEEVAQLAQEQDKNHQLQAIQQDPVFRTVLSDDEMDADRDVDEEIRAADRERRRGTGLKQVERQGKHDQAQGKIDGEDLKEQVTLRKAQRKRRQLTDGAASLVSTYRRYRGVATGLAMLTVAGIAWTSHGVATALGGPNPMWLYYVVEPLFSLPLLAIVFMQVTAAENGRLKQVSPLRWITKSGGQQVRRPSAIGYIETGLLMGTLVINVSPAIADFVSSEHLFSRIGGPVLIIITVVLQLVAAELFGDIIREVTLDGDNDDASARERAKRAADKAVLILHAMREASIELQSDGYPSVKEIGRRAHCEKAVAQSARDILPTFVEGVK